MYDFQVLPKVVAVEPTNEVRLQFERFVTVFRHFGILTPNTTHRRLLPLPRKLPEGGEQP